MQEEREGNWGRAQQFPWVGQTAESQETGQLQFTGQRRESCEDQGSSDTQQSTDEYMCVRKRLEAGKEPPQGPETVPAPRSLAGKFLIHGALDKALRKGLRWWWETAGFSHTAPLRSHPTRHKSTTTFSIFFTLAILMDVYSSLT